MLVALNGTHTFDSIAIQASRVLLDVGAYQVLADVDSEQGLHGYRSAFPHDLVLHNPVLKYWSIFA